jgi:hypothetical protein
MKGYGGTTTAMAQHTARGVEASMVAGDGCDQPHRYASSSPLPFIPSSSTIVASMDFPQILSSYEKAMPLSSCLK